MKHIPPASPKNPVHFVGIGGIGMSALARWCKAHKWNVSGSDAESSPITAALRRDGIRIMRGHRASHVPRAAILVVKSQAIPPKNPEIVAARANGIPILSYPEMLGRITEMSRTLAVAGAHGKSTTTALAALMLIAGKKNPTVIVGTNLKELGSRNFRSGSDSLLVLEADEYGRAFLRYSPSVAIVTNIDREHLDTYPSLRDVQKAFMQFLARVAHGGKLILNRDNAPLASCAPHIRRLAERRNLSVYWYSLQNKLARDVRRVIRIPGEHNVSNAIGALTAVTKAFKVPLRTALRALAAYRGAWRRMEYRGRFEVLGVRLKNDSLKPITYNLKTNVYDDYAHHPTEIKATLAAFREKFSRSPLICVFQPHQALRLQKLFSDFVAAFTDADMLILLPTYQVAGRDRINPRFTSETLAKTIQKKYPKKLTFYLANPKKLKSALISLISPLQPKTYNLKPVIVMMGAGNIVQLTDELLQ